MDARSPLVQQGALLLGRGWDRIKAGWQVVSSFEFAVGAFRLILIFAALVLGWLWLEPSPIRSIEVVEVGPEDRVIDRAQDGHLAVVRRVCATRDTEVRLTRSWVDGGGGVLPTLDDWATVKEGCHVRPPVIIYPPPMLSPGMARYVVVVHWCNRLRCEEYHIPGIDVLLVNQSIRPPPAPQPHRF